MIQAGQDILASDFIDASGGVGDAGKGVKLNSAGKIGRTMYQNAFGGNGSDGALNISSGTTTINLGGAAVYTKNYSSISITGTAKLAFTNPGTNGTLITLKSAGDVTITSSTVPAIDVRLMGAAAGNFSIGNQGGAGFGRNGVVFNNWPSGSQGPDSGNYGNEPMYAYRRNGGHIAAGIVGGIAQLCCGAGGGASVAAGGRGGGAILIECAGALNITSTIDASGENGTTIGGGGGGGGTIGIVYNTLTNNSGTYVVAGGSGGSSGQSGWGGAGGAGGGGALGDGGDGPAGAVNMNGTVSGGASGGVGVSYVVPNTLWI